jgi:cell division ATPase FtsA
MEKYILNVVRIEYSIKEIEVDAEDIESAKHEAISKAYDQYYEPSNVFSVEYKISDF